MEDGTSFIMFIRAAELLTFRKGGPKTLLPIETRPN